MFEWTFQAGRESIEDYDYMSDSDLEDIEDSSAVQNDTVPVKGKDRPSASGSVKPAPEVNGDTVDEKGTGTGGAPLEVCGHRTTVCILSELCRQQTDWRAPGNRSSWRPLRIRREQPRVR